LHNDIIYDIMNKKKLNRLKKKLEDLRAGKANLKREQLLSFAKSIEREESKRGKEGTYISTILLNRNPISIPKNRKFNKYTVGSILDEFEKDLFVLSLFLCGFR